MQTSPPPEVPPAPRHATLTDAARAVLATADARAKAARATAVAEAWRTAAMSDVGSAGAPARPARPARPDLRAPRDMPKRRAAGSEAGRVALLHALAHIELNAIDLAFDMVARFADDTLPMTFCNDWTALGGEEAKHFLMLDDRLRNLGAAYGDLPAHDGLWEAAAVTSDDLLARLAVVPLVLEARGLDVTPPMIARMSRFGDAETARVLTTIYEDEIGHVAVSVRWFRFVAEQRGRDAPTAWRELVAARFRGALKPPFNTAARERAGFPKDWYEALVR